MADVSKTKAVLARQRGEKRSIDVEATFTPGEMRMEPRRYQMNMPVHIHRALRIKAAQEGTTMTALILAAIESTYDLS